MVFSSLPFLFLFLPITVIVYYCLLRNSYGKYALPFVLLASLFFYAYWKPSYLFIILFSIIFNYFVGQSIAKASTWRKPIFIAGLSVNILLLVYFKYIGFLFETINNTGYIHLSIPEIVLPIGISFYTFQQLAYLADIYTKKHAVAKGDFLEYATFVCFFPQLIAGPIVHHAEMMPQFAAKENQVLQWKHIYIGLCFLSIGLAKKVLVADTFAPLVNFCFDRASSLTFIEAILGCFAYIIQIYFDFSGYADMAIGCAYFFNIKLPYNFDSPYKAASISEFWQRWHITLSFWIRNYIYFPLGGNKKGTVRAMCNVFITFILGGLWHGAGWGFIIWGVLHGLALIVHRIWAKALNLSMPRAFSWPLTFLFVTFAAIAIRSVNYDRLDIVLDGLLGYNGFDVRERFSLFSQSTLERIFGISAGWELYALLMVFFLGIAFICRNSQELIMAYHESRKFYAFVTILLLCSICLLVLSGYSPEFIYFNF